MKMTARSMSTTASIHFTARSRQPKRSLIDSDAYPVLGALADPLSSKMSSYASARKREWQSISRERVKSSSLPEARVIKDSRSRLFRSGRQFSVAVMVIPVQGRYFSAVPGGEGLVVSAELYSDAVAYEEVLRRSVDVPPR